MGIDKYWRPLMALKTAILPCSCKISKAAISLSMKDFFNIKITSVAIHRNTKYNVLFTENRDLTWLLIDMFHVLRRLIYEQK